MFASYSIIATEHKKSMVLDYALMVSEVLMAFIPYIRINLIPSYFALRSVVIRYCIMFFFAWGSNQKKISKIISMFSCKISCKIISVVFLTLKTSSLNYCKLGIHRYVYKA